MGYLEGTINNPTGIDIWRNIMEIYVSKESRGGDGTKEYPLNSLAQAAAIAKPGDEVIVAPGVYREYINPACAGTPERRIVYRSEVKNGAVIFSESIIHILLKYSEIGMMLLSRYIRVRFTSIIRHYMKPIR